MRRTLLAAALASPAAAPAGAQVVCGQLVTASLKLKNDLACTGPGLVVGAPNIVIDLGGRRLAGDGDDADNGIDNTAGHAGVTVRKGRVEGFGTGVRLVAATGNVLERLGLEGNGTGIVILNGPSNTIRLNQVEASTLNGIDLQQLGPDRDRAEPRLTGNMGNGIRALVSGGSQLVRNRLTGNQNGGIVLSSSPTCSVESNRVDRNLNNGILVGSSDGVVLTRNRLTRSGSVGMILGNGNAAQVDRNRVSRSGDTGLQIEAGSGHQVTANVVSRNANHGIFAGVNTLTIESNRANGNGLVNGVRDGVGLGISAPDGTLGASNKARGNDDQAECQPASLCN